MGTAIVSGAASGIGRALATQLARKGHYVHLIDVQPTEELARELGGAATTLDVARPNEWADLAARAPEVDWLCLNAGIIGPTVGAPWEAAPEEWDQMLAVNLLGVVNGLRAFIPPMLAADRLGHVLITASLAGLLSFPGGGAYAATKHALVAVAEQTSLALADTGLTVTLLCPALVRSGMSEVGADPEEVATLALDACGRGDFLVVSDEWTRALTRRTENLLSGRPPTLPEPSAPPSARGAWLPDGWQHPTRVELSTGHHLRPIRAEDTDLDLPAIMGSRERLWSIYGEAWGWPPATMTAEQDRLDLQHHAHEIETHESFNYALLDAEESELIGCVYIEPTDRAGADADISWWVRDEYLGSAAEAALDELVPAWISTDWPMTAPRYVGRDLTWTEWLAIPRDRH